MIAWRRAAAICPALGVLLVVAGIAQASPRVYLVDAVELIEVARKGNRLDLDTEMHLRAVDRRSRINLEFDHELLRQAAVRYGPAGAGLPPEDPEAARQRLTASRLLNALQAYLDKWREFHGDLAAFRMREQMRAESDDDSNDEERAKDIATLEKRSRELDMTLMDWQDVANEWSLERARQRGWSVEEDDDGNFVDQRTEALIAMDEAALYPDEVLFDPVVLAGILNEQFEVISEEMIATLESLDDNRLVLSARAFLLRPGAERPVRMQVQNYDDLEAPVGQAEKSILGLTKSDIQELQNRFKVTEEFARFANDLRREESDLRQALAQTADSLGDLLADLDRHLGTLFPPSMTGDLLTEIEAVMASADLTAEKRAAVDRIERAWLATDALQKGVRSLVNRIKADPKGTLKKLEPLKAELKQRKADFDTLKGLVPDLPADLQTLSTRIEAIAEDQANAMRERAESVAAALSEDFLAAIGPAVDALGEYELVTDALMAVLASTTTQINAAAMSEALDDYDAIRPRPLDTVIPGAVFLRDYAAQHGDELRIVVEFLHPDDGTYDSLEAADFRLSVREFGGFSTLDASLIFVERIEIPEGSTTDSFLASPALSLTAHYRKRQDTEGAHGWAGIWNGLNPGLGINVAALSFDGRSGQYGVGFQFTLFGDILQAGYGWNLNVGSDREYWFLGVGLVDALNLASTTMGNMTR